MKVAAGIYLPDDDEHFAAILAESPLFEGKGTYQLRKIDLALESTRRFAHAVVVGAHVGLWARVLAGRFTRLTALEPMPAYRECFVLNLDDKPNVRLLPYAAGEQSGLVRMDHAPSGQGSGHIAEEGAIEVEMRRLDELRLGRIDFLRVNCEGAELPVIRGGEAVIRRHRPVIVIEQKSKRTSLQGHPRQGALSLLEGWGATVQRHMAGDYVVGW